MAKRSRTPAIDRSRVQATRAKLAAADRAVAQRAPFQLEPERNRLVRRFAKVAHVDEDVGAKLADGQSPAALGLRGVARRGAERIQGATDDFLSVSFLSAGADAATAVARVIDGRTNEAIGTGFLIGAGLFITNNHVIESAAEADAYLAEFDYEVDRWGADRPVTRFALRWLDLTSPEQQLDYTLLRIGERVEGAKTLSQFGRCPLSAAGDKHSLGELVNIIQHPNGERKQVVIRENRLVNRFDNALHYVADTLGGSSGSPVFNDQWEVIALHHWGEPFIADGEQREVNEGVRISAIVADMQRRAATLDAQTRQDIDAALREAAEYGGQPEGGVITAPNPERPVYRKEAQAMPKITIPLTITISVGDDSSPDIVITPVPSADWRRGAEKVQPDPNYANRNGYDVGFLGESLALPRLSAAQKASLAKPAGGGAAGVLKYQNFSVVMNGDRKFAFFTAANIDGAKWVDIDRDSGQPRREAAEAKEVWFVDPRLDESLQTNQALYDEQKPRRLFDRGHLVRRQDPTWGAHAVRANADTFHFTNGAPQASTFNQSLSVWQGIEAFVLNNVRDDGGRKVSVFTGPVLSDDDPPYRDVLLPLQFWKIAAWIEDGELCAVALFADQSKYIKRMPEALRESAEAFEITEKVEEFQTTVAHLEEITGLDFGRLRAADVGGGQESFARPRALDSFADLRLRRRR